MNCSSNFFDHKKIDIIILVDAQEFAEILFRLFFLDDTNLFKLIVELNILNDVNFVRFDLRLDNLLDGYRLKECLSCGLVIAQILYKSVHNSLGLQSQVSVIQMPLRLRQVLIKT